VLELGRAVAARSIIVMPRLPEDERPKQEKLKNKGIGNILLKVYPYDLPGA
jgi:hypothetical protein